MEAPRKYTKQSQLAHLHKQFTRYLDKLRLVRLPLKTVERRLSFWLATFNTPDISIEERAKFFIAALPHFTLQQAVDSINEALEDIKIQETAIKPLKYED